MSSLPDQALALALDGLRAGGLIPFAIVNGRTSTTFNIVTERSDTAMNVGRRLVRQHARDCDEYVIAVDMFVRIDGERHDAVVIEAGARGTASAELHANAYADGAWSRPPVLLGSRPSALLDPHELRWGDTITPDVVNPESNLAVHTISHELESDANVARTIRFVRARICHHARVLPPGMRQLVAIDDRGQAITPANRSKLRGAFEDVAVELMTERTG